MNRFITPHVLAAVLRVSSSPLLSTTLAIFSATVFPALSSALPICSRYSASRTSVRHNSGVNASGESI